MQNSSRNQKSSCRPHHYNRRTQDNKIYKILFASKTLTQTFPWIQLWPRGLRCWWHSCSWTRHSPWQGELLKIILRIFDHFDKGKSWPFFCRALVLEEGERRGRWLLALLKDTGHPWYIDYWPLIMIYWSYIMILIPHGYRSLVTALWPLTLHNNPIYCLHIFNHPISLSEPLLPHRVLPKTNMSTGGESTGTPFQYQSYACPGGRLLLQNTSNSAAGLVFEQVAPQ